MQINLHFVPPRISVSFQCVLSVCGEIAFFTRVSFIGVEAEKVSSQVFLARKSQVAVATLAFSFH